MARARPVITGLTVLTQVEHGALQDWLQDWWSIGGQAACQVSPIVPVDTHLLSRNTRDHPDLIRKRFHSYTYKIPSY